MSQPLDAPALFQTYVRRMADSAIAQIRAAGEGLPSEEERDLALNTLSYALSAPDIWPTASHLLTELAPKMEQAGHRREWIEYLEEGITQSQTRGDAKTEAELRLQLGVLHQFLAEFEPARMQLGRSMDLFTDLADEHGRARAINRLARTAWRQGSFAEAEALANQALSLTGDEAEQAYSRLVLGAAALLSRKWTEAVLPLETSLAVWERRGDKRMSAWAHTNLGSVYRRLDDYDRRAAICARRSRSLPKSAIPSIKPGPQSRSATLTSCVRNTRKRWIITCRQNASSASPKTNLIWPTSIWALARLTAIWAAGPRRSKRTRQALTDGTNSTIWQKPPTP